MDRKTLVLLPGLDGTGIFFEPLLARLPAWIDPVVVTYPPGGPNGYEDLIDIVDRAVAHLPGFAILGWSFGGPLALKLAASRPSQVSEVILCSTFVTPPRPELAPLRFAAIPPVIAAVRAVRRLRFWIPGFASVQMREAKARTWRQVGSRVLAARVRAALGVDARQLLVDCRQRLIYIAASDDRVIPAANLAQVRACAPGISVAEIDGPHMALFTNPAQAAARIAAFLRGEPQGLPGSLTFSTLSNSTL